MSIKVVYNARYGGFSISRACAQRMAELGSEEAAALIAESEESEQFHGYLYETPRHDPILVQAVEELGEAAGGKLASLGVHELTGRKYIIDEYDGSESVVEPQDIVWTLVD